MKRIISIMIIMLLGLGAMANENGAMNFFRTFEQSSNNYSSNILDMYSSNARIIRQVVKPNGQLVNAYFSAKDYKKQMVLSSKVAKIRNYKNYYSDINVTKVSNGYKISAKRKPSSSNYKLNMYMIVQEQSNGKWLIVEEMMQTKEQIFLKYAK